MQFLKRVAAHVLPKFLIRVVTQHVTPAFDCDPLVKGKGPVISITEDPVLEEMSRRYGFGGKLGQWFFAYFGLVEAIWRGRVYDRDPLRIHEGDVILDGGANRGVFTVYASLKSKEVIAVEPYEDFIKYLKLNLECNNLKNVVVVQGALAEEEGPFSLRLYDDYGVLPTNRERDRRTLGRIEVKGYTLDSLLSQFPITAVKLSLEGMEYEVVRGTRANEVDKWWIYLPDAHMGAKLVDLFAKSGLETFVLERRDWRLIKRRIMYAWNPIGRKRVPLSRSAFR